MEKIKSINVGLVNWQNISFRGDGAKGNLSAHDEGHNGSLFMKAKHAGFTIEVL